MIEYKYDKEHYIYNPNRDAIKKWLLNIPSTYIDLVLEIVQDFPFNERYINGNHCYSEDYFNGIDESYYDDEETMWLACFKDLNIDFEDKDIYTFQYLLYAFVAWLSYSKNMKMFKIHNKKQAIEKDFTNA